ENLNDRRGGPETMPAARRGGCVWALDSDSRAGMNAGLQRNGRAERRAGNAPRGRKSMARAFVFPGQGSQAVGMGQALAEAFPAARLVFEEVDDALKQHLTRLMFEGPEADLTLTENAQPA